MSNQCWLGTGKKSTMSQEEWTHDQGRERHKNKSPTQRHSRGRVYSVVMLIASTFIRNIRQAGLGYLAAIYSKCPNSANIDFKTKKKCENTFPNECGLGTRTRSVEHLPDPGSCDISRGVQSAHQPNTLSSSYRLRAGAKPWPTRGRNRLRWSGTNLRPDERSSKKGRRKKNKNYVN